MKSKAQKLWEAPLGQSKVDSFIESCFNVGSGFIVALLVWQLLVVPLWGFEVTMSDNLAVTGIFTVVSVIRGYIWRRVFNGRKLR